jgi:hypothetical protein
LHVPVRILEGNGEQTIDESNVRVLVNPVDAQLPDELAEWRAEIAAEQDRRREVDERPAWNGASYAVEDLIIERVGPQEDPAVTFILKHCDYYTFLATQRLDRRLRGGATPHREVSTWMGASLTRFQILCVRASAKTSLSSPPTIGCWYLFEAIRSTQAEDCGTPRQMSRYPEIRTRSTARRRTCSWLHAAVFARSSTFCRTNMNSTCWRSMS